MAKGDCISVHKMYRDIGRAGRWAGRATGAGARGRARRACGRQARKQALGAGGRRARGAARRGCVGARGAQGRGRAGQHAAGRGRRAAWALGARSGVLLGWPGLCTWCTRPIFGSF